MKSRNVNVTPWKFILTLLFLGIFTFQSMAACGPITGVSTTVTNATCPANGQIVVNSSVSGEPTATYRIISGPTGYPTNTFTSNTIPSLLPGTYQIEITCDSYVATTSATVGNSYIPPTITTNVTSCTGHTSGGNIEVSAAAGSAAPLQYAVVLSDDPTIVLPASAYAPLTGTVNFAAAAYGAYQVKIKDACNNITTKSVEVKKTSPRAEFETHAKLYNCTDVTAGFVLREYPYGNVIDKLNAGYRLELWTSSTTACPAVAGTPEQNLIINTNADLTFPIATKRVAYRITSPCGEVTTGCRELPDFVFEANAKVNFYCSGNIGSISVQHNGSPNYTLTYVGYDASNVAVPGASGTVGPQSFSTFYFPGSGLTSTNIARFQYTFTDGCGRSVTGSVNVPPPGGGTIDDQSFETWCTTTLGAGVLRLWLGGHIEGMGDVEPSRVQLIPVGGGAPYTPADVNRETWQATFYNVLPGSYNLVIQGNSAGACSTTIPVTVTGTGLNFTMDGTSSQLCGGLGSISATATTNSQSPVIYTLKNSAGTVLSTNSNGNFVNLSHDTYTVEASIVAECSGLPSLVQSKTFTITPGAAGPQVIRKVGVICEPSTTTGKAIMDIAGSGPFKVEMKLSTEPESAFVVKSTNAGSIYTENDLAANTTYNFRITDACGITTSTEVTILPLITVNKLTTMSPCVGQSYTLAVDNLPGATYSWTKNGASLGTNLPQLQFTSFAATDNGTYVCTISFSGCVSRTVTYTINSTFCGSPLSVKFGNVSAVMANDQLLVNWSTESEENNRLFEVEVSADGQHFKKIGTVDSKATAGNSQGLLEYSFAANAGTATALGITVLALLMVPAVRRRKQLMAIIAIAAITFIGVSCNKNKDKTVDTADGNIYVRVAQVDTDGGKGYSKIVKVVKQ